MVPCEQVQQAFPESWGQYYLKTFRKGTPTKKEGKEEESKGQHTTGKKNTVKDNVNQKFSTYFPTHMKHI